VTLKQALAHARELLAAVKDVENPSLESEVLLRSVLNLSRAQFFLDLNQYLNPEQEAAYSEWIERRMQDEPLAYILRCREFFGLDFFVDERVLIPRPETELLVEEAISFAQSNPVTTVADIGTGSGVIAVSLAVNLLHSTSQNAKPSPSVRAPSPPSYYSRQPKIYAADISSPALKVAAINCLKHHVSEGVILLQGDLLAPLPEPVDILIANLPYISSVELAQMPSARFEPVIALDGGESGMDKLSQLCYQLQGKVNPGGCVLIEIGSGQSRAVSSLLCELYPSATIEVLPDLAGIDRVVKVTF
jgi:release factor glutamine methyltransferase